VDEIAIGEDITLQEYYEQKLPQIFAAQIQENPPTDLAGQEYRINYDIDGTRYGVIIRNGTQMEIVPGGLENSHLSSSLNENDWRDLVTGKILVDDPIRKYNTLKHFNKIKNFKGLFKLCLSRNEGPDFLSSTVFNGVDTPEVTIKAKVSDYSLIQTGKMNPQMAMMIGKVKFEGSTPFLMMLGTLNQ